MGRRYRASKDDYYFFSTVNSVYGMLRPIEEKLRAAGYKGPVLNDFNNYMDLINDAELSDHRHFYIDLQIKEGNTLSKDQEKEFRKYLRKYENYLDLLIKNTPKSEYSEELDEIRFHKAYIRMVKIFGSRELLSDQLYFASHGKGYDADFGSINELDDGNRKISRELWENVHKYYPYSDFRNSITDVINVVCDYEENKDKDSYIEQIKYRDKYKKSLQNYLSACQSMEHGRVKWIEIAKNKERIAVFEELEKSKAPDDNTDYRAVYKRVAEQKKNKIKPSPADESIYNAITKKVNSRFKENKMHYGEYNTLFGHELEGMGFYVNIEDFTGFRGTNLGSHMAEAQIKAIDHGWPMDEIQNIQRLQIVISDGFKISGKDFEPKHENAINRAKEFYNRIKDMDYPTTEAARQEMYQELYEISVDIADYTKTTEQGFEDPEPYTVDWNIFRDGLKKTMSKPLTFAQKMTLDHVVNDQAPEVTEATITGIKALIDAKRFAHSNSTEYEKLQIAYNNFVESFRDNPAGYTNFKTTKLSAERLEVLKKLRASAAHYLKEKDKDKKLSTDRSTLGQNRYEGAQKAYHLADMMIKVHEAKIESEAKAKKEAKNVKGRKETREAFFDKDSAKGKNAIKFEIYEAGGKEEYEARLAEEERMAAENENKVPTTEEEKYEKYIKQCRLKKDEPITLEDEVENKALQKDRINRLGLMLAAIEAEEAGKPFNPEDIQKRATEIKDLYSLSVLKNNTEALNGPEKLANALTYGFRAKDIKKEFEQSLYEVRKVKYKNYAESQIKYQTDINTLLKRNRPGNLSEKDQKIIEALTEIKNVDLSDNTMVALNSYKIRKANLKLMKAVSDSFKGVDRIDKNSYSVNLALNSLAVLDTYTGCKPVANKLLHRINANMRDMEGDELNINIEDFKLNYGVKHSKDVNRQIRENIQQQENQIIEHPHQGNQVVENPQHQGDHIVENPQHKGTQINENPHVNKNKKHI